MCNIYHRATFRYWMDGFWVTLCIEHIIGSFRLSKSIHNPPIKRVGMPSPLVIERVPQSTADMLAMNQTQRSIVCTRIWRICIMPSMYQHGDLPPTTGNATGRILTRPIIRIIPPFSTKICLSGIIRNQCQLFFSIYSMGEYHWIKFCPFGIFITGTIAIRKWILFSNYIQCVLRKRFRKPCFIQQRFPHPHRSMIPIPTYNITNIGMNPLLKNRILTPVMPSGSIENLILSQLVTSFHKSRVLLIVRVTYHFHTRIT